MIPLFWPQTIKGEWLSELNEVFSSRWIGQGPKVDEFEKRFGEKFGYGDYCIAVNSGTSALELAYELAGIGPGDEVVTSVLTCTATNIPLVRRGAKIVFADIGNDLVIDLEDIKKKVNDKTKALVVVTLGGLELDHRIYEFAWYEGLTTIVDAAQSLGVTERNRGRDWHFDGDYVCYSFQAIKHFTTGDGGMLVINSENDEAYEAAKKLRWFGIDREKKKANNWQWGVQHQMAQDIEMAGYKFHMNDIAASMGIVGLRHSDEILAYRKKLCERYAKNLYGRVECVYGGSYWLFGILVDNRDEIMAHLRNNEVECDLVQIRNDIFKIFGGSRLPLPNMNRLESQYLYLPLNCRVTIDDVDYISEQILKARPVFNPSYQTCERCNQLHYIHQRCLI